MTLNYITIAIYAAIVLIGGIIGFIKASSSASLISGLIFSAILSYFGFLMYRDQSRTALAGAIITVGLLAAFFAYRYLITSAFMPPGMMAIISFVTVAILLSTQNKMG